MNCWIYIKNANKAGREARQEFLYRAAQIPGIYVPTFYDVTYHEDGTIASFAPNRESVPESDRKTDCNGYVRMLPIRRNRLFHLLRLLRTVWFWRFSEDVSVDAVSARLVCCIVRPENVMWKC